MADNDSASVEIFDASEFTYAVLEINITEVTAQVQKKYRRLNLKVRCVDGATEDSVCGRMGLGLSLAINTQKTGDSVNLIIVNNNSFAVDVSFSKLKLM